MSAAADSGNFSFVKRALDQEARDRLHQASEQLAEYKLQNARPPWQIFFIQYSILFKSLLYVIAFVCIRYALVQYGYVSGGSHLLDDALPVPWVTPLVSGSLFFFSFMVHGVVADYKEAEKVPSNATNAMDEYYHSATICIRQSHKQGKCTEDIAADLHSLVLAGVVEMLCIFRKALLEDEHVDFTKDLRELMTDIDRLNMRMLEILGPNPVATTLVAAPKGLRTQIRRVRTMIDTEFWPVGHIFMIAILIINTIVLAIVKSEQEIADYSLIPGLVFMFIFIVLMMGDIEDPFSHNVSQRPLEELRERLLVAIDKLHGNSMFI